MKNAVIDNILTRRSVRKFLNKPVEEDKLDLILEAGIYAPTGRGRQSPIIIAVRNPEDKKTLREMNAEIMGINGDPYYGADVIVLVLASSDVHTKVEDGSCVLENMMLAAHSLGLGSCWIHREKEMFDSEKGKSLLHKWGIEGNYTGVGALAIGYPDGAVAAKPRKNDYIYKF